jgi:hypothetical protein
MLVSVEFMRRALEEEEVRLPEEVVRLLRA